MQIGDLTRIRSNVQALSLLSNLRQVNNGLATHQLRLATGLRINSAADDPAGLTLATKLNASHRVWSALYDNTGQAKNMLAVAEGVLLELSETLTTMSEKIASSANDTLGDEERAAITTELMGMVGEIGDVTAEAVFNGKALLGGTQTYSFQTGKNSSISWTSAAYDAAALGLASTAGLTSEDRIDSSNYTTYRDEVDAALSVVSTGLNALGSVLNRLTIKEEVISVMRNNTEAAYNRVIGADAAEEQIAVTKYQVLQQTAIDVLAQAAYNTQLVLNLFD